MANLMDRRSFDLPASAATQQTLQAHAARLEALLDQRDADVKAAMAEYFAEGVSDVYQAAEQRWDAAGRATRGVIDYLKNALGLNDETAIMTMGKAGDAANAITA